MNKGVGVAAGERLVPIRESAHLLGMSVRTLERRIAEGLMPRPSYNGRNRVYPLSTIDETIRKIIGGGPWER